MFGILCSSISADVTLVAFTFGNISFIFADKWSHNMSCKNMRAFHLQESLED